MTGALFLALLLVLALGFAGWLASLSTGRVTFVDSLWPVFFLAAAGAYAATAGGWTGRGALVAALLIAWALRLGLHLHRRNAGQPEDRRYQALRAAHPPFAIRSLYLVFGLQALLAWAVSMPLAAALLATNRLNAIDLAALLLWATGMVVETVADRQLARFRAEPANAGRVLDTGLWRYSRHPNHFGECCVWWAFYLFAVAAGGWWTLLSPVLMTVLLLRISGVALLERDIADRRPAYRAYQHRTNAFLPGLPRRAGGARAAGEAGR